MPKTGQRRDGWGNVHGGPLFSDHHFTSTPHTFNVRGKRTRVIEVCESSLPRCGLVTRTKVDTPRNLLSNPEGEAYISSCM